MTMRIYWINELKKPGKLGMMPRPRAGDWLNDEIQWLAERNVSTVISHLEKTEELELDITSEGKLCVEKGIEFIRYPILDRSTPKDLGSYLNLIADIDRRLENGGNVVIHCRMGIGRTGMTAASVLLKNGWDADQVFKSLSDIRTLEMPDTEEQIQFVCDIKLVL